MIWMAYDENGNALDTLDHPGGVDALKRKIEAYDNARATVKIEGNTRAYYVLRAEAAEEALRQIRAMVVMSDGTTDSYDGTANPVIAEIAERVIGPYPTKAEGEAPKRCTAGCDRTFHSDCEAHGTKNAPELWT